MASPDVLSSFRTSLEIHSTIPYSHSFHKQEVKILQSPKNTCVLFFLPKFRENLRVVTLDSTPYKRLTLCFPPHQKNFAVSMGRFVFNVAYQYIFRILLHNFEAFFPNITHTPTQIGGSYIANSAMLNYFMYFALLYVQQHTSSRALRLLCEAAKARLAPRHVDRHEIVVFVGGAAAAFLNYTLFLHLTR